MGCDKLNIFSVAAVAVVTSLLALSLVKANPHTSLIISLCGGCIILIFAFGHIAPLVTLIKSMAVIGNINDEYIKIALKAAGLGITVSVCSAICTDAGQTAVAAKLEIAGRIAILCTAIPVISGMFNAVISAIG